MNFEILRGLLIEEMGRARADAFLERYQFIAGSEARRTENETLKARVSVLEAEAKQRADEIAGETFEDRKVSGVSAGRVQHDPPAAPHFPS